MSRSANCYDNAFMESFFGTLEREWVHERRYRTRQEARLSIFEYVEVFDIQSRLLRRFLSQRRHLTHHHTQISQVIYCVGGVISPLLANIALSAIEERYELWVNHQQKLRAHRSCDGITAAMRIRMSDRKAGRPVFFPIRYANDFIVLTSGTFEGACKDKQVLEEYLKDNAGLTLSPEKTHITSVKDGFNFLGHRIHMRWDDRYGFTPRIEIPKVKAIDVRYLIKQITSRRNVLLSPSAILHMINLSYEDGVTSIASALEQSAY